MEELEPDRRMDWLYASDEEDKPTFGVRPSSTACADPTDAALGLCTDYASRTTKTPYQPSGS